MALPGAGVQTSAGSCRSYPTSVLEQGAGGECGCCHHMAHQLCVLLTAGPGVRKVNERQCPGYHVQ